MRDIYDDLPYIIEIDGKRLKNVKRFTLSLDNRKNTKDSCIDVNDFTYSIEYYAISNDDLSDILSGR